MNVYTYILCTIYLVLYFSYVLRFQVFCSVNNVIGFLVYTIIILYTYIFIYKHGNVCVNVVLNCLLCVHRFIYFLFLPSLNYDTYAYAKRHDANKRRGCRYVFVHLRKIRYTQVVVVVADAVVVTVHV